MSDLITEDSPAPETPAEVVAPVTPEATTDVAADPSPADAKEAPAPTLLDVVKDVVAPKEAAKEPEAPSAADAEKPKAEAEAPKELSAEEIAALPFHNHPRFKEVLDQKNAFKAQTEELSAKIEALTQPAEQWGNVRTFMGDNGLSDQDMLDLFKMGALIRTDPIKGRAAIAEYLGEVDRALGLVLPDDLREDVESGMISEERALELSQHRATTAAQTVQASAQAKEQEQAQAAQAQQELATRLTSAATDWETRTRSRDPDFDAKQELIADRMRAISMAERVFPQTSEDLGKLLDRAHQDVTAHLRKFVPRPPSVARPTSAAPATVAAPEPKTMRDAVAFAARG